MDTAALFGSLITVILFATSGMALVQTGKANARPVRVVRKVGRPRR
jgi:hypothetical protein